MFGNKRETREKLDTLLSDFHILRREVSLLRRLIQPPVPVPDHIHFYRKPDGSVFLLSPNHRRELGLFLNGCCACGCNSYDREHTPDTKNKRLTAELVHVGMNDIQEGDWLFKAELSGCEAQPTPDKRITEYVLMTERYRNLTMGWDGVGASLIPYSFQGDYAPYFYYKVRFKD